MKKIVDVNFLEDSKLGNYLSESKDNFIILTDFACMECLKCNVHNNLKWKLDIISRYPKQILILKGTRALTNLTLYSNKKIPQSLIDIEQTSVFPEFCRQVFSENTPFLHDDLLSRQNLASEEIESLANNHELRVAGIKELLKIYDPSHIKSLRKGEELPEDFTIKFTQNIISETVMVCKKHPDIQSLPDKKNIINSYIFRYLVSTHFLDLKWIKDGGIDNLSKERLRNDMVDMSYVAYATYFDGLLSKDNKMNDIYRCVIRYLDWADECLF